MNDQELLHLIRVIADLRVMHSKVDELYQVVTMLRHRHGDSDVLHYADQDVLGEDIRKIMDIYVWFNRLREKREKAG